MDERGVAGAEVVQGHLHAVAREPGHGVRRPLRVLQQDVFRYLQLQPARRYSVAGQSRGDRTRETGGVDVARRDVDGDRDLQALGPPPCHLGEGGLQHVLRQVRHQPGGLGDRDELVRGHPPAFRVHPSHQGFEPGHLAVETDLRLVVEFHFAGVEGPAEVAEEAQAVGGVAVPLGLVHLHARTVALRLVHGHVRAPQQSLRVQRVVGEDGEAGAGLQDEREAVQVEGGAELRDQVAGDALGAGGGVGDGEQDGELVAAEPGGLGVLGQGLAQPVGDLEEQPVARQVAQGVVDRAEAVQVDQHKSCPGAQTFSLVQGGPGALQQPLPVRQPGQGIAQLLLGARPGDPQGGVQRDQGYGEQRQQDRLRDRDDADEGGDAEQRHGY